MKSDDPGIFFAHTVKGWKREADNEANDVIFFRSLFKISLNLYHP